MFLRDAVVNDQIPSVTRGDFGGFFAYRFGHAVFDFIEERWGKEGFLDFIYEIRNTLGSRVDRAVKRAFKMEPEDFDAEFRRWLRKKYLPELVKTGEPRDFGRVFRIEEERQRELRRPRRWRRPPATWWPRCRSTAARSTSSSTTPRTRKLLRNLTKGYSNDYQYLVGPGAALGRQLGRDISFSPDGNTLAVFAKRERGAQPAAGGRPQRRRARDHRHERHRAAGRARLAPGRQDARLLRLARTASSTSSSSTSQRGRSPTSPTTSVFDGAPVFSPDGRSLVFVSTVGSGRKIFRIDLDKPGVALPGHHRRVERERSGLLARRQADLLHLRPQTGADNIFSLDLANGKLRQHTNVVTGAFMPTVLREPEARSGWSTTATGRGTSTSTSTDDRRAGQGGADDPDRGGARPAEGAAALRARHPGDPRRRQQGAATAGASSSSRTPTATSASTATRPTSAASCSRSPTTWATTGSSPT